MRRVFLASVALGLLPVACAAASIPSPNASPSPIQSPQPDGTPRALRYVALGDSYTIGTSVGEAERWPNQLVERLRGEVALELVDNLGVNGFTSGDLIDVELRELDGLQPDFATVLIGVNDVVQHVPEQQYQANVVEILSALLAELPPERIVVVSVPDYTRTPQGGAFGGRDQQRAGIARVNDIMQREATRRGIAFVDIGPVADAIEGDLSMVARDQLHPSGKQYGAWVGLIAPVVTDLLGQTP